MSKPDNSLFGWNYPIGTKDDMPDFVPGDCARAILVFALDVLEECKERAENQHGKSGAVWQECYHAIEAIENLLDE